MSNSIKTMVSIILCFILCGLPSLFAQEAEPDAFTLEEITVTSEKRATNLQTLPSSVVALQGADLVKQGRITTAQILESVPNLTFRNGADMNPNGNIAIRGVQRTVNGGGLNDILPSTTATYTDGVYQGIGGNYDLNRVEVLRGPQGTLYGRSATGGVVSFYTNDPKLSEFSGKVYGEVGTASLKNFEAVVNIPAGDKFAVRMAGHYWEKDGYFNGEGGRNETKEGRIKALYQPTDALGIVLSLSAQESVNNGGGYIPTFISPTEIDYEGTLTEVSVGSPLKYRQAALNVDYDLGWSTFTYIGGFHDFDNTGLSALDMFNGVGLRTQREWDTNWQHYEEVRLASDPDGKFTWLVGANYFRHRYETTELTLQALAPPDPELTAADDMAPIFSKYDDGSFTNYGLFTEETFKLSDDFRITAGLRYDSTEQVLTEGSGFNSNTTSLMNAMNPPVWMYADPLEDYKQKYSNITYKLRFEYDLTETSMLYALAATGFMPGSVAVTTMFPAGFQTLEHDQEKLTSYEIGSKNQFLNNTLRLNAAAFYYDYDGYSEAVNLNLFPGPPAHAVIAFPVEMMGVEVSGEWLLTMYDKFSFDAGWLKTEITSYPDLGIFGSAENYAVFKELPGNPKLRAKVNYDHTFVFGDGSTLVPLCQLIYTGGYYVSDQLNYIQAAPLGADLGDSVVGLGEKPYAYQDAYVLGNVVLTWTSAASRYSITGYVRNVTDEEYKLEVGSSATGISTMAITPGDPRTFGLSVTAKF